MAYALSKSQRLLSVPKIHYAVAGQGSQDRVLWIGSYVVKPKMQQAGFNAEAGKVAET